MNWDQVEGKWKQFSSAGYLVDDQIALLVEHAPTQCVQSVQMELQKWQLFDPPHHCTHHPELHCPE